MLLRAGLLRRCLPSPPRRYPTLASGVAHGSGTGPGSIRVLTCNAGFVLTVF